MPKNSAAGQPSSLCLQCLQVEDLISAFPPKDSIKSNMISNRIIQSNLLIKRMIPPADGKMNTRKSGNTANQDTSFSVNFWGLPLLNK